MKTTEQVKDRKSRAQCYMIDSKKRLDNAYHAGWYDALDWVLKSGDYDDRYQ